MARAERTQVGIVGAGPAGLLLAHLLYLQGIDSVVLEARSRTHVENRIRAGVLEHGTAELLAQSGLGARMRAHGLQHDGTILRFDGRDHRIDFKALTGKSVTVYSQHEVVRDLIAARIGTGAPLVFEADAVSVHDLDDEQCSIHYRVDGLAHTLACDFIAGCDGFHGVCRPSIPAGVLSVFERVYPFGWLGILADAAPSSHELVYAAHDRGFALLSLRSPTVSRLYLQCAPDEDVETWSDTRIWEELGLRLAAEGFALQTGRITQKGVTPMRSFLVEPMQYGRLFLLGDAAHIVPPTGAKGLNMAAGDVAVLNLALGAWYRDRDARDLARYSETCLRRVWKVQRFSWWMTSLLHRFENHTPFEQRVQRAERDELVGSIAAATALAESYVGLPLA